MNNRILNICSSVILLSSVVLSAAIQAQTLNDVLDQARSVREAETALFQQRITDFNATAAADQQRLMREAAATRTQIQAAVQEKTNQFSANDLQISTLNVEMREKANTLGLGGCFGLICRRGRLILILPG